VQDQTDDDAAVLGVVLEDEIETSDDCEVWEENWPVLELFLRCQTQWRTGMSGPVGLDYNAVAWVLKLTAEEASHRSLLEDLQIMEGAVLGFIAKQES
jgi:Iap family predicted aminopeptidase